MRDEDPARGRTRLPARATVALRSIHDRIPEEARAVSGQIVWCASSCKSSSWRKPGSTLTFNMDTGSPPPGGGSGMTILGGGSGMTILLCNELVGHHTSETE